MYANKSHEGLCANMSTQTHLNSYVCLIGQQWKLWVNHGATEEWNSRLWVNRKMHIYRHRRRHQKQSWRIFTKISTLGMFWLKQQQQQKPLPFPPLPSPLHLLTLFPTLTHFSLSLIITFYSFTGTIHHLCNENNQNLIYKSICITGTSCLVLFSVTIDLDKYMSMCGYRWRVRTSCNCNKQNYRLKGQPMTYRTYLQLWVIICLT